MLSAFHSEAIRDAISYFWGKYSNNGGLRPKAAPSVSHYVVRFNVEENARFLSMFEQSGAINKAAFIKNFLFQKPFKVFVVGENTRIFISQLSSLYALYRTYGVSYDTLVKTLRENFSEKKCNAAIERLREATMRLVSVLTFKNWPNSSTIAINRPCWTNKDIKRKRRQETTSLSTLNLSIHCSAHCSVYRSIVPHLSIGAIIGANPQFIGVTIGAIGAIIEDNKEFVCNIFL